MATQQEKVELWVDAIERTRMAGDALVKAIKLFQSGGAQATSAWEAVQASRLAHAATQEEERRAWKRIGLTEPGDQTEMPGVEQPGPKGPRSGPKLLGPGKTEAADG